MISTMREPARADVAPDPSTQPPHHRRLPGNNAWGSHALRHGTTQDHVLSVEAVLSDATVVRFDPERQPPGTN